MNSGATDAPRQAGKPLWTAMSSVENALRVLPALAHAGRAGQPLREIARRFMLSKPGSDGVFFGFALRNLRRTNVRDRISPPRFGGGTNFADRSELGGYPSNVAPGGAAVGRTI